MANSDAWDINNIKDALSRPLGCSTATVASLRSLFNDEADQIFKTSSRTSHPSRITARKTSTVKRLEVPPRRLSPEVKLSVAIEITNASLKALSDAIKGLHSPQKSSLAANGTSTDEDENTAPDSTSDRNVSLLGSASRTRHALKPRSSNATLRPAASGQEPDIAIEKPPYALHIVAVAECGRTALAYLRTHQDAGRAGLEPLQLENAMLALVGKCVANHLAEPALKELRQLKRRLDRLCGCEEGTGVSTIDLLRFETREMEGPILSLVISHQISVLRLLGILKRPSLVEAVLPLLEPSSPSSPASRLLQQAQDSKLKAKSVQQLEGLARLFLQLGDTSSEVRIAENKAALKPECTLRLKWLALRTRIAWWSSCGHKPDIEKEIWALFSKGLTIFSRTLRDPTDGYRLGLGFCNDLSTAVETYHNSGLEECSTGISIFRTLSTLAEMAEDIPAAIHWTSKAQGLCVRSRASDAKLASFAIRLAALHLRQGSATSAGSLGQAINCLSGALKGDSRELDELLLETSSLRKAISQVTVRNTMPDLGPLLFKGTFACLRLLTRYIGQPPPPAADAKRHLTYSMRLGVARPIIRPFVETAFQQVKQLFSQTDIDLETFDAMLQCVCALVAGVRSSTDARAESIMQDLGLPMVKVSGLYFVYHNLRAKAVGPSDAQGIRALQRSVEALRSCSSEEKAAGFFTMKLEKMGEVYQKAGHYHQAYDALEEAMTEYIAGGILLQAAELARSNPLRAVYGSGRLADFQRIAKHIHLLKTKLYLSAEEFDTALDMLSFSDEERAVFLEMQLGLWAQSLLKTSTIECKQACEITTIIASLLDSYAPTRHPIRLQRVTATVLQMASEHPKLVSQEQMEQLRAATMLGSDSQPLGADTGLSSYKQTIASSLSVIVALREVPVNSVAIKTALYRLQKVVNSHATWKSFLSCVDDPDNFINLLRSAADYLEFQGLHHLTAPTLSLLTQVLSISEPAASSDLVSNLSRAGLQLAHMGYSSSGALALAKAEQILHSTDTPSTIKLEYYLAYAEYLLAIGSTAKCGQTLEEVSSLAKAEGVSTKDSRVQNHLSSARLYNLLAKAFHTYSRYCMEVGLLERAFDYARRALKITQYLWTETENRCKPKSPLPNPIADDKNAEMEKLANGMSSLMSKSAAGTPVIISQTCDALSGPAYWSLVPKLIHSMCHLATIFAHCGQLQEAQYHIEKAKRVADSIDLNPSKLALLSQLAELHIRANCVETARPLLDTAAEVRSKVESGLEVAQYLRVVSQARGASDTPVGDFKALDEALSLLAQLETRSAASLTLFESEEDQLVDDIANLQLNSNRRAKRKPRPNTANKTQPKSFSKANATRTGKTSSTGLINGSALTSECIPIRSLRGKILSDKSVLLSRQNQIAAATESLRLAALNQYSNEAIIQQSIARFRVAVASAMKEIASDFTFNMLPESTLSLPAVKVEANLHGKGVLLSSPQPGTMTTQSPSPRKKGRPKAAHKVSNLAVLLQDARDCLHGVHTLAMRTGANTTAEAVNSLLGNVSIMLSAACPGTVCSGIHPLTTGMYLDLPKIHSCNRERSIFKIESSHLPRDQLLLWPDLKDDGNAVMNANEFQRDYIDIIPEAWTAISITLSDAKDDLLFTRYRAGQSPFILRLPLTRQHARDTDEDIFGYARGMAELREIIDLAIQSAHGSKSVTTKAGKLEWWEEREALDSRLKDLLVNIENIWLGGFRGFLTQQPLETSLLAKFNKRFQGILDRHLPSRQGRGARKQTNLDTRILELFTGLGDPSDESLDLDEALVDLLYFVVDILQFNGERNAYDEIDFDSMVIETIDALNAYHTSNTDQATNQHTILILDKHLHCIPWESLPSLCNLSITRLPSLAALRSRLLDMQATDSQVANREVVGFHVSKNSGHSILNPSGDLTNTETIMSPHLSTLPSAWVHSTTIPTEPLLSTTLSSNPLVLYFGHGSGSQYIRPRAVKKLPRCATTWLMGCSSAAITDNGEFEPSGMVLAYLAAGAPAVVGTLWDVTDRDCDRASVEIGASWGLWKEQTQVMAKFKKARGKRGVETARGPDENATAQTRKGRRQQKGAPGEQEPVPVGLAEAVVKGRRACHLKYLNGAAFVVYGVPVYLRG